MKQTRRAFFFTPVTVVLTCCSRHSAEAVQTMRADHLVGICMSPLFLAHAQGYFKDEALDVQLKWIPNPGDSIAALNGKAAEIIHNPFTATYVANENGADLKIIAGSGNGGLYVLARPQSGIKKLEDLKMLA